MKRRIPARIKIISLKGLGIKSHGERIRSTATDRLIPSGDIVVPV
jgi:hypothetical protein